MKNKILNAIPDLTFFSTIACAFLAGKLFPEPQILPNPVNFIIGGIFVVAGIILSVATLVFLRSHGGSTNVVRTSNVLITNKYFSFSRNPLYLAELAVVTGVAVMVGSLAAFIAPAVYLFVLNTVISYEEKKLEKVFGGKYAAYKKSTRKWI